MKFSLKLALVSFAVLFIFLIFLHFNSNRPPKTEAAENEPPTAVTIAAVVCGLNRVDESLVMIKSALIFAAADTSLHFVIVAESELHEAIDVRLQELAKAKRFTHEILGLSFPLENRENWRKLFKPCASQRLFLPSLLPHVDSLIYVDCDVVFVSSPRLLHGHFRSFDRAQMAALASESENRNTGWYTRFARHPYYAPFGLNSGVMLMNLTRMRSAGFEDQMAPIYDQYRNQLAWGDQDIVNIYFERRPSAVHLLKCEFNYRPDHCMYTPNCALDTGVKVLHANRGYFHKEGKQRIFREVYRAIEEYQFADDPCTHLVKVIEQRVADAEASSCNELVNEFLFIPKKTFCRDPNNEVDNFGAVKVIE